MLSTKINYADVVLASTEFLALIILFICFWKLYCGYGRKKNWASVLIGTGIFLIEAFLYLLSDISAIPKALPEHYFYTINVLGIVAFSFGIISIVRDLLNMVVTDPLTALYNKRYLTRELTLEIERSKRYGYSFSILFICLENLKEINSRMGRLIGNYVLRNFADKLKGKIRSIDVLCYYGRDKFVLLMPQTSFEGAKVALKRLRDEVSVFDYPGGNKIDLYGGIAVFPEDADNAVQLISMADRRMHSEKS